MTIRSKYTSKSRSSRPQNAQHGSSGSHTQQPKTAGQKKPSLTEKAKKAIHAFAKYVEKNQRDNQSGDYFTGVKKAGKRVVNEYGEMGREEITRIERMRHADSDEEIVRFMSGRGKPKQQQPQQQQSQRPQSREQYIEFVVKPKRKPRPKVIRMPYDPDAEVEW